MSVLPICVPSPCAHHTNPVAIDDFGLGITPQEILALMEFSRLRMGPHAHALPHPHPHIASKLEHCTIGKDGFQVCTDVKHFKPKEITVKTVDHTIVVEGKHEERKDEHGHISRQFTRKYALPKGYDPKEVVSSLSSDGVLTIKAPSPKEAVKNERVVHIQQTGPAHLNVKENPKENPKEEPNHKK